MAWTRTLTRLAFVATLCVGLSGVARAECLKAYTGEELVNDLSAMTTSLRSLDEVTFLKAGSRLDASLPCIKTPVPRPVFASAYRFIGTYHFFKGDESAARMWFRSALEIEPTFVWDITEVELTHPMRAVFDQERAMATAEPVLLEGKVLNKPAGSSLFLDGKKLSAPEATSDRPHLLQVIGDSDKSVRKVFLIQGNAFPEQLLMDESMVAVAPVDPKKDKKKKKNKKGEVAVAGGDYEVQTIQRVRPAAKTPMMIAGGIVAIGSGVVYGMSFAAHRDFENAETTADLEAQRKRTNTLVIASGVTLAVGIGVEYAGLMLDGGQPGIVVGGRF